MNRLKKAWLALTGRTNEVGPKVVNHTIYLPEPNEWHNYFKAVIYENGPFSEPTVEYFHSCEQARQTHPGAYVTVALGFEVNGRTFIAPDSLKPIEVQPKPKRPKGRAA
jgi:hypothetical protein